ncbi:hypothetical protein [Pelagicoccus sp. SDUM812002]|uniref:hypothetical protein n=1 Tax=Pelagicoccus sp. SDUM812002 TaxID=3041266 RepID=UPI00280D657B|nr:hypothetical protein [Pelagicoccus sp. SDUM812002]MDQ8188579.1 hypothetical protein [Pelagicoccus sp. SDUM812002]
MKKKIQIGLSSFLVLVLAAQLILMQLGLANYGQEFGTYGQYNRVVRLVNEDSRYKITNHGLNRDLDWKNLDHLNRFYVKIRTTNDEEIEIDFLEDSSEMKVSNEEELKKIIDKKVSEQVARYNSGQAPRVVDAAR